MTVCDMCSIQNVHCKPMPNILHSLSCVLHGYICCSEDCESISNIVHRPTAQSISSEALCSPQPHAIAPLDAHREFAVAEQLCSSSMCNKTSIQSHHLYSTSTETLDGMRRRVASSIHDVLLAVNVYVD
jgi:hypothetical protein